MAEELRRLHRIINPMGATRQQGHKSLRHLIADIQSRFVIESCVGELERALKPRLFACSTQQSARPASCIVGILGLAARTVTSEQGLAIERY